jgi:hypothetical protein
MNSIYYVYCPETGYTKYQHSTFESAKQEAERLARIYSGRRFQVLALVGQCIKADTIWDLVEPDTVPF